MTPNAALLVVDMQNDFMPGGALAVPRGHEIVEPINRLAQRFANVVLTQDWHCPGHASFASSHPGRQVYETIDAFYGPQILWPDHCVMGSHGAALHPDLDIRHAGLILRKGYHKAVDSYSAFLEADRETRTVLALSALVMPVTEPRSVSRALRSISAVSTPPNFVSGSLPRYMFSAMERLASTECSWNTVETPASSASRGDAKLTI